MPPISGWGARTTRSRILWIASVLSIMGWAVPALVMANKGFSVQDEGSYVLSYRWWASNPYFVSESQYFYGPIFQALHYNIAALRVLRLAMALGCNLWFALAFVRWLALRRGGSLQLGSSPSLVALLTASGGMTYLFSPLTPGYYDLTAQASLVLTALMFSALKSAAKTPLWIPFLAGMVAVVLSLTKWSAASVVLVTQLVVLVALWRASSSHALRYVAMLISGFAAAVTLCQLFLVRLDRLVPILGHVSALTADGNHGLGYLAQSYLHSTALFVVGGLVLAAPMILGYLIGLRLEATGSERSATFAVLVGAVLTAAIPAVCGWHGGSAKGRVMVSVVLAAFIASAVIASRSRHQILRIGRSEPMVVALLVVVPFAQAAGTNVPLLYVAFECMAMWVATLLVLASHQRSHVGSTALTAYLALLVAAIAALVGTTTLMTPFKTTSVTADTVPVTQLGGLRLAPLTAQQDNALRDAAAAFVTPGVTPVFSLDELAGLTYQLGGVPMGSTWTDQGSVERTAGILEMACHNGDVDLTQAPILLLNRRPDPAVTRALEACGYIFPTDFREMPVPEGPPGVQLYVPIAARGPSSGLQTS